MNVKSKRVMADCREECLTVTLSGEIDHHTAPEFREEIDRYLYLHRPRVFRLSLAGVHFMDSSGLGLILGRLAVCHDLACPMHVSGANERIERIFRMARLSRMEGLTLEPTKGKEKDREKTDK